MSTWTACVCQKWRDVWNMFRREMEEMKEIEHCEQSGKTEWDEAVCMAVHMEGHTGREEKLCQLKRLAQLVVITLAEGALL